MLPEFPEAAPLAGLAGGAMIGLAAMMFLLGAGRIAGISGIAARAIGAERGGVSRGMALAFMGGLVLGALAISWATGGVEARFAPNWLLVPAGLLVGFGTRLGHGCTSGHGVCGVSRLSRRSIVATVTFMASGIATVAAMNALGFAW